MVTGTWVLHPGNQSLTALVGRAGGSQALALALGGVACLLAAVALRRNPAPGEVPAEIGIVTLVAVLVSPIAWSHYFMLALPAWTVALMPRRARWGPVRASVLLLAGIATSGWLTIWSYESKRMLLSQSIFTWGGLLLCGVLLSERLSSTEWVGVPNPPPGS
jgi:hypothetical protein